MSTIIALEPVSPGHTGLSDYRYRSGAGERTVLPQGLQQSPDANQPGPDREDSTDNQQSPDRDSNPPPTRSRSADFAAAVIAGALPPTPTSMNELIRRIGTSEIPEESQARLKDLLA